VQDAIMLYSPRITSREANITYNYEHCKSVISRIVSQRKNMALEACPRVA